MTDDHSTPTNPPAGCNLSLQPIGGNAKRGDASKPTVRLLEVGTERDGKGAQPGSRSAARLSRGGAVAEYSLVRDTVVL